MGLQIDAFGEDRDFYFQLAGIDPNVPLWNGHSITVADADAIKESIESRIQALFLTEDPSSPGYLLAATYFAYKGSQGCPLVEKDIVELLNTPEGLMAVEDGVIVPAGWLSDSWKFVKKHAVEIAIGVAVVAVITAVVIIAVATGGSGTAPAAAAGGAILSGLAGGSDDKPAPNSTPPAHSPPADALRDLPFPLPPASTGFDPSTLPPTPDLSDPRFKPVPFPYQYVEPPDIANHQPVPPSPFPSWTPEFAIPAPPQTPIEYPFTSPKPLFEESPRDWITAGPPPEVPNSYPPGQFFPPGPFTPGSYTPFALTEYGTGAPVLDPSKSWQGAPPFQETPFVFTQYGTGAPVIDPSKSWQHEKGTPPFQEIPLIGDKTKGTFHFHCGINNYPFSVEEGGNRLFSTLDEFYAVQPHLIHSSNPVAGLTQVGLEKLEGGSRSLLAAGLPMQGNLTAELSKLPSFLLEHSTIQRSIDYTAATLSRMADEIIATGKPNLKQLHITFSNGGHVFKEALTQLTPEQRNTIIVIPVGTTAIIDETLACKVYNVIGDKDWPSKVCNGGEAGIERARERAVIEIIQQTATEGAFGGHYFLQPDYQFKIKDLVNKKIENEYEIY